MWRRHPGFAALAVGTLGAGLSMYVAIFSAVRAVLLRPLPYRDPQRLCVLWKTVPQKNITQDWTSYPTFRDWVERNRSFEEMTFAIRPDGARVLLGGGAEPVETQAAKVGKNFFDILGVAPILGRTFSLDEYARGERVAVVSYRFWRERLRGMPGAVGRQIEIDGRSAQVIGVMPERFAYPYATAQIWLPMTADARWSKFATVRLADAFSVLARLKPGISVAQAQADMEGIARQLAREYPKTDEGLGIVVRPLAREVAGASERRTLWTLFAAVTLLLLIACSNVANLLLVRGAGRGRELAIRFALGAGRGRVVRELLAESLWLWLGGVALAVALAPALIRVFVAASPAAPRLKEARIDFVAMAVGLGVSLATGLIFGLIPAWKASGACANAWARRRGAGGSPGRAPGALVAIECALAMTLLAGAGLLARSLIYTARVDPGYRADHLLTMEVHLPPEKYRAGQRAALFFEQALERINALPGVRGAAAGGVFHGHLPNDQLVLEGRAGERDMTSPAVNSSDVVSEDYFQTMGIPLLRGRFFAAADRDDTLPVAIVNRTMAQRCWPGENPLGKRFRYGVPGLLSGWITVAGVVADALPNGPESRPMALYYLPLRQHPWVELNLVVRTVSDPAKMANAVRGVIRELDPGVPRFKMATVEEQLAVLNAPRRFETWLLGIFSLAALTLASMGIYGVIHYSVARRTREIGIRIALGARPADVVRIVVGQAAGLAGIGMGIGMLGALALSRLMQTLLFGVTATDPLTFATAAMILLASACGASWAPARRAAQVDPMVVLRAD